MNWCVRRIVLTNLCAVALIAGVAFLRFRLTHTSVSAITLLGSPNAPVIDGIAQQLENRVSKLKNSALNMESAAMKKETEAADDTAALKFMRQAQDELNAYELNFQGLTTVVGNSHLKAVASQFPKEAAELHALIDHSLSEVDSIAVGLTRESAFPSSENSVKGVPILAQTASTSTIKHAVHKKAMHSSARSVNMAVVKATKELTNNKIVSPVSSRSAELAKLQRVKSFERKADAKGSRTRRAAAKAALSRALAIPHSLAPPALSSAGPTQMLVQPGPLHGALPVRDGALRRQGTLWNPKKLGWEERDPEVGDFAALYKDNAPGGAPPSWRDSPTRYNPPTWRGILAASKKNASAAAAANATNATKHKWHPEDDVRLACNSTCRQAILHSVTGISFKVAKECVPTCATSDYTLKTTGAPLPSWKTVDELRSQDEQCDADPDYMKCKLKLLKPVCLKLEEVMPQYCPVKQDVSICASCARLEEFMLTQADASVSKKERAKMEAASPAAECPLGISWLC